eukprot:CAMPEP_0170168490 /NCGR_PEP_ID=MMETSP0040_2-20121228/1509_1 /TAXON_ID=641309 /ORGANISM="Lotharella oceanica, Strain CCMP622" /LENGTH=396 /DNA_ID=CAMNT_0010406751 /DNA_START=39 /DNA_END=1229 /DNA_ORIENTATION=-
MEHANPILESKVIIRQIEGLQNTRKRIVKECNDWSGKLMKTKTDIEETRSKCEQFRKLIRRLFRKRADLEITLMERKVVDGLRIKQKNEKNVVNLENELNSLKLQHAKAFAARNDAEAILDAQIDAYNETEVQFDIECRKKEYGNYIQNLRKGIGEAEIQKQALRKASEELSESIASKKFLLKVTQEEIETLSNEAKGIQRKYVETLSRDCANFESKILTLKEDIALAQSKLILLNRQHRTLKDKAPSVSNNSYHQESIIQRPQDTADERHGSNAAETTAVCQYCQRHFKNSHGLAVHKRWCKLKPNASVEEQRSSKTNSSPSSSSQTYNMFRSFESFERNFRSSEKILKRPKKRRRHIVERKTTQPTCTMKYDPPRLARKPNEAQFILSIEVLHL